MIKIQILQSYYKFIGRFNTLFGSLRASDNGALPVNFQPFTEQENFGLTDFELKSETKTIDDTLFKKIYEYLLFTKQKLLFLVGYKKSFLEDLIQKNEALVAKHEAITELYESNLGNNVIKSMYLKTSQNNLFNFNYLFKNGFVVKNKKIFPVFKKINKLECDVVSYSGKVNIKFNNSVFLSMMNLVFSRELNDQIIISYKTKGDTETKFVTQPITLSKNKFISLCFEDCTEITISSNVQFNEYLTSLTCYGGFETTEYAQGYGVLDIEHSSNIVSLMIESQPELFFYKVNKNIFSSLQTTNSYYDFENNSAFERIQANLFQSINFSDDDLVVFVFDTNQGFLNEPLIYGGVSDVD